MVADLSHDGWILVLLATIAAGFLLVLGLLVLLDWILRRLGGDGLY